MKKFLNALAILLICAGLGEISLRPVCAQKQGVRHSGTHRGLILRR